MERNEMIEMYSDFYKDAYGFRPRFDFPSLTTAELQSDFDDFGRMIDENNTNEDLMETQAIADFEKTLVDTMRHGAKDEDEALQWVVGAEIDVNKVHSFQDIEQYVYNQGLLFTDYGKHLIKRIECFVTQCIFIEGR